ncbi:MAG: TrmH family RNA methyltransferase [SAR324 cluster bacterium]
MLNVPMDAADTVIAKLEPLLLPRRVARMRAVLAARSDHVTFVFERMTDPHNLSAALRSLDAFGFQDAYWIAPDPAVLAPSGAGAPHPPAPSPPSGEGELGYASTIKSLSAMAESLLPGQPGAVRREGEVVVPPARGRTLPPVPPASGRNMGLSHAITRGTDRWLTLNAYADAASCCFALRERGYRVLASDVTPGSPSLDTLDLDARTAFVFGSEHDGLTPETLALCDGRFHIAMHGFTESLNLSVACAITAFRCRQAIARLAETAGDPQRFTLPPWRAKDLYVEWLKHSVRRADEVLGE